MRTRNFTFRKPTEADIAYLIAHMRENDRRELKRWTGVDVAWNVRNSITQSTICYSGVFEDGRLACIFGATRKNLMEEDAVLWMLSTDAVDSHRVEFALGSKAGLDKICREMPDVAEFGNFVDMEYGAACRWIEWFGASFSLQGKCSGVSGGVFRPFYYLNPYYKQKED